MSKQVLEKMNSLIDFVTARNIINMNYTSVSFFLQFRWVTTNNSLCCLCDRLSTET